MGMFKSLTPARGVEARPIHKLKGAPQSWGDLPGNECSFDWNRSRATHGIEQRLVSLPAARQHHRSSDSLAKGSLCDLLSIPSTMQQLSGAVRAYLAVIVYDA